MKSRWLTLFILLASISTFNKAEGGEFYADVEALYWQPMHTPIIAGRRIGPDGGGLRPRENLLIEGCFDWGVRVRGGYAFCSTFVELSYLYYDASDTEHFSADGGIIRMPSGATTDNLQSLTSKLDWRYQNVDLRYGQYLIRNCHWELYGYAYGRWVEVKLRNLDTGVRVTPATQPDTFSVNSDFTGGGLGIGLGGAYSICGDLRVKSSFGAMAVYGTLDHEIVRFFEADVVLNPTLCLTEKPCTYALPAVEFRLGFEYPFCLSCFRLSAEVGYELDYYFDISRHNIGIDRSEEDDSPLLMYCSAGFGGPYFRLGASF